MSAGTLQDADTLQAVAAWLTREEAGLLLAPLCKAGRSLVRAADAAEDAGQKQIWLAGLSMWDIDRVHARIDKRWGVDDNADAVPGLAEILKSLATTIETLVEILCVERVFERSQARAGRQASVLGCHRLVVVEEEMFLRHMQDWLRSTRADKDAWPTVCMYGNKRVDKPETQLVLNLLQVLGLRAGRGRGMRLPPDVDVSANEVLWVRQYVAQSLSARGWQ
jgi:hypothetical protein